MPAFKVSSGDLTNLPFLRYLASKGLPLIVSTGMATMDEVQVAVDAIRDAGGRELSLLHCVSNYPADPADTNLRAMHAMRTAFGAPVGYSDHTLGNEVSFAAVALGACVIEKHMTVDRSLPGPDHQASSEPWELTALVAGIRVIESSLGSGEKRPAASEAATASVARRSLVAARTIAVGATLVANMLTSKRPGTGMAPARIGELVGRTARVEIAAGELLALEMVE